MKNAEGAHTHTHMHRERERERGLMVKEMDCEIELCEFDPSRTIMFIFGLKPFGNVWTPLSSKLWVKKYHFCSFRRVTYIYIYIYMVKMNLVLGLSNFEWDLG